MKDLDRSVMLTPDEVKALRFALDAYLPELRYEESRIELPRDRHELVQLEEKLTALRKRLDE